MRQTDFEQEFLKLTEKVPFPWQQSLYRLFMDGQVPASCNLPTGLGKTSVIAIWLIALANGASLPRRLVYVVNRRTVVDQTTEEVERYRGKLLATVGRTPLAISTLRGQFADNREWSADPSRPAVICGTVDMIGSRLLFSGYGCGFKTRPLYAGFLGQDSLIVHDEAHLEPAFQRLLKEVVDEQKRSNDFHPIKVMELTATSRDSCEVFELTDDDRIHPEVRKRIDAKKNLYLHETRKASKPAEAISEKALDLGKKHSGATILVFVSSVEDVDKVTKKLPKDSWEQLTGTLRGLERDRLVQKPIFQSFLPGSDPVEPAKGSVYLVCTSAGEVGVNISADHLVCDLTPFESMAQRFGRVNRFGDREDTEIHVCHPEAFQGKDPLCNVRQLTLGLLQKLKGDASPANLGALDQNERQAAFTPPPIFLPTSDILFDAWSLTTIRDRLPGRPHVEPYLHGIADWQPAETYVAWRQEVDEIGGELLEKFPPEDLLEDYPLKPHELLRDRSKRVAEHLAELAKRCPESPAWILEDSGRIQVLALKDLGTKAAESLISHATVLLPPFVGGLTEGRLDGSSDQADDVADELFDGEGLHRRVRLWDDKRLPGKMRLIRTIDTRPDVGEHFEGRRFWRWYELSASAETEGSKASRQPVAWQVHTDDVVSRVERIVEPLLPDALKRVFRIAAECHDLGKRRKIFQTVIGNRDFPALVLAKSGRNGGCIPVPAVSGRGA